MLPTEHEISFPKISKNSETISETQNLCCSTSTVSEISLFLGRPTLCACSQVPTVPTIICATDEGPIEGNVMTKGLVFFKS